MDKILFKAIIGGTTGYTGDYQNSYDMYCRAVHYAVLHDVKVAGYSMSCVKPDKSSSVLFSMYSDRCREYEPCSECKYVDQCSEQGNPYKDLHE